MNMKKDKKFSKEIKESLHIFLYDYNININIKSTEHVKTDMNTSCFTMCFEQDKLKDLTISFIFEFSSYLKINIESELDTNISSINFGNMGDKRERDGVCCWLIEYIKSYFEKQYEDTVTNISESEHTNTETININKLSRNIELKPFNGVNEKSNHDGDFEQTHVSYIEDISLSEVSRNDISFDFTIVENFYFTDEQKNEIIEKITKKANSIIRKKIKKFKAKNKRIEESKIPSDWEIATDPDFENIIPTIPTHLSVIEIDPLSYLVKTLTNNPKTVYRNIIRNCVYFTCRNIIDTIHKGDIKVHYIIYGDISDKNIIVHSIEYDVIVAGEIIYNRNIDISLLRDYRNFNELILR